MSDGCWRRVATGVIRLGLVACLAGIAPVVPAQQESAPRPPVERPRLMEFELEDQFRRKWTHEDYNDRVVLAIATGKKSSDLAFEWGEKIAEAFPAQLDSGEMAVLAVASLRGVPKFLRGVVVGRFPEREDRWVLMDWKGAFAKQYGLDTDIASLLLFDRAGLLVSSFPTESVNEFQLAILQAQIDELVAAVPRP